MIFLLNKNKRKNKKTYQAGKVLFHQLSVHPALSICHPGVNVIKLCSFSFILRSKKLEHLSVDSIFSLVWYLRQRLKTTWV